MVPSIFLEVDWKGDGCSKKALFLSPPLGISYIGKIQVVVCFPLRV